MRKPYFVVTAECRNERCATAVFAKEKKNVVRKSTGGQPYTTDALVCPACGQWGRVTEIREVK